GGTVYLGDTLVICTGAQARWLGLPSEATFKGYGLSACATCDGFFFKGRPVAVIGGGNAATEEALFLTNFASSVTLVHRRDRLRSEKILQDRLFKHPKIRTVWNSVVEEVLGETKAGEPPRVTGLKLRNAETGAVSRLDVEGVFVAIGHVPATALFKGKLPMDEAGYLLTRPDSTATSVPGVFAAGDVKDKVFRQAVTAAGMGCMAALEAERFIAAHEHEVTAAAAD
ncbi:MAG: FAD-dependent oxidoreductase, partial [Alphaproteobacteria bacterium]|nr:FAD-dependent oxidoreductase [Alphaproteobacteria bacterium]